MLHCSLKSLAKGEDENRRENEVFSTTPQHFLGREKTPSEHSCDSEPELGSSGLSRLSVGIKHKGRFAKFPCAEPC